VVQSIECTSCGFDLGALSARVRVAAKDGGVKNVSCPICGNGVILRVQAFGILVRGSGAATSYSRWKLSAKDDNLNSVRVGRFALDFETMGSLEPREICYPRIPVFLSEDGKLSAPAIPVRTEFFDCLDERLLKEHARVGMVGEIVGAQYLVTLPLKGLKEPVRVGIPIVTPEPGPASRDNAFREFNLRVWPNLEIKEWKYYLAGFAGTGSVGDALVAEGRVRGFVRTIDSPDWRPIDGIQRVGAARVTQLDARPQWIAIELVAPAKPGEPITVTAGGIFSVPEALQAASATEAKFGLDFGTSNTCVGVSQFMTTHEAEPQILTPVSETAWNLYLVRGGEEAKNPQGPDLWPSPHAFGKFGDLMPTELLFQKPKRDMSPALAAIDSWRYGKDFGMPRAAVIPGFSESEYALGDFKWRRMLQRSAPNFAGHIEALQAHYLTAILTWAYVRAAISSRQAANQVTVLYSQPMSFDDSDSKALGASAELASTRLTSLTGIDWHLQQSVDESTAAAMNAGETSANVLVYLDMGGGSTDIAIKLRTGSKKWETVYVTSVVYAGGVLLHGYAGGGDPRNSCLAGKVTVDTLRRKVREARDAKDLLGDPTLFNRAFERVTNTRTQHFYGYLIELVARMLAAGVLDQRFREVREGALKFPTELKFGFFFLGNGWGFAGQAAGDVPSILSEQIFLRAFALIKAEKSSYATAVKGATKGVQFSHEAGKLLKVPHAKAAVALGVLKAVGVAGEMRAEPRSGILGWDTKADERDIPWFVRYTRAGSTGPLPPRTSATDARAVVVLTLDDEPSPVDVSVIETPWYAPVSSSARLDWQNVPPALPETLEKPFDLDPGLNQTRGPLKARCEVNAGQFFSEGPYEVMLEVLFAAKIAEIV
jgi:hypothetical protein